ncbi:MAG: YybH family protein [Streptomyces sp.]|uniref:YybH family protein n=1 Tax=Streptomyces sp. TaxID=1931 RepID=UPI003D6B601B
MSTPAETIERFTHAVNEGDLETALALYEPDAVFQPAPDVPTVSGSTIREALNDFFALKPRMTGEVIKVHEAGDIALVINRWRMSGTGPNGEAIEMAGTSADVLRRRGGGWGILVDDPWGAAV